MLILTIN